MKQILLFFLLFISLQSAAQNSVWTLERCIAYAQENNLSIQSAVLDNRISKVGLHSAKSSYYPSLSLSSTYGNNLGRSINPTTNQFENTQFSSVGLNASANVLLFGWFQKRHAVQKSQLQVLQAQQNYEQAQDDIALNVSTAYLRILLALEQINNVKYQIELSLANNSRINTLLESGKSNMLELSQSQTQLATDSSVFLQAVLNFELSIIELKTLLNIDYQQIFIIDTAITEIIPFFEKQDITHVYQLALEHHHSIITSELKLKIAAKEVHISKANGLPQLSLYYGTGTNYSSSYYEFLPNGQRQLMNFSKQINTNLSHSFGLSLSVPIFNNFNNSNNIKTARLSLQKFQINNQEVRQKLEKDVYSACTDYELSYQKYLNGQNILTHAQTSYKAALVRLEAGLISYFEYNTEKNKLLKAQNEASALKYELWFKRLLVSYYKNGNFRNN